MGITPDRQDGPSIEEEIQLTDEGVDPSVIGAIVQKTGALLGKDSVGIFNLRSGSGSRVGLLVFKEDGGLVYDTSGAIQLKVNE